MCHSTKVMRPSASKPAAAHYVLHPGDVTLAFRGERLETLLGSCVALVLTDPRRTVGAMCHIVHCNLPPRAAREDTAYAAPATREMFRRLLGVGITPKFCLAYVVGGGNMFPDQFGASNVGASNVLWVQDFLQAQGISVLAESVGGPFYRKLGWTVGPAEPEVEAVAVAPQTT